MRINVLIIISIFFWSCKESNSKIDSETYKQEEIKALNDIFLQMRYPQMTSKGFSLNVLVCKDSLICIPPSIHSLVMDRIQNFSAHFPTLESTYKHMLFELSDCKKVTFLDIQKITNTGNYKLIQSKNNQYTNKEKQIDIIQYSRIIFDNSFSKGVLYESIECGSLCGNEMILFIKMENGKWKIIASNTLGES